MRAVWTPAGTPVVPVDVLPDQPSLPRIKVLHVITKFWAGAGGNTLLTAIGTDPARYEVWVAGCEGGPLWQRAQSAGIRTVQLRGFRETIAPLHDLRVLLQLIRLIRRERFSIVHTHSAKGGFLGRLAAWLCGVPVILYTFHGFSYHDFMSPARRWIYLHLERVAGYVTDAFFAVAPRVAREAIDQRLAPPGGVTVAPSAVELSGIPEVDTDAFRAERGIPANARIVGTVGRLDYQKAPLDFVRMAALIAGHRADVRFVMVGDGSLRTDAEREAARLGVEIILTGERNDAPAIAASFDVFVISSLYEGLGRALTEALASGRPVVATAVNGVPDLVEPGVTGLLAVPGEPASLASGVEWFLDHPDEARRMGAQARDRVRSLFPPQRMCAIVQSRYDEMMGLLAAGAPAGAPDHAIRDAAQPAQVLVPSNGRDGAHRDRDAWAPRSNGPVPVAGFSSPGARSRDDRPAPPAPDARALNWTFLVPADASAVFLLPSDGERLDGAIVAERNAEALRAAIAEGPYPAVAAPDITGWASLIGSSRATERLLARLAACVEPGGWLYAGFANARSPFHLLGTAALSRQRATGILRSKGFGDVDVYVAFPDHRTPAYLVSAARDAELEYFMQQLSFPHTGPADGLKGALRRRAIAGAQRVARSVPGGVGARFVPSMSVVARRTA